MKKIIIALLLLFGVAVNVLLLAMPAKSSQATITLRMEVAAEKNHTYQIFYEEGNGFSEANSALASYAGTGTAQTLEFVIPKQTTKLRLDLGMQSDRHDITAFALCYGETVIYDSVTGLENLVQTENMIDSIRWEEKTEIVTNGEDAFLILDFSTAGLAEQMQAADEEYRMAANIKKLVLFDILFVVVFFGFLKFYNHAKAYALDLWSNRKVILNLSKNDFKVKYAGSYLGIVWAFIQPVVTIAVYWFVFQIGFRSGSVVEGYPYIVWLITGLIPWFFFVEALSSGTNCLLDYNYLVKKVVFPIDILPVIRILATYYVHIFFMLFMFVIFFLYGFAPDIYWLQVIYCEICVIVMLAGLIYATSALVVFFKDLSQIIVIVLQVGLWMTPILWDYSSLINNPVLLFILKLNPVFYIIEQYRNALIYHKWFWEDFYLTIYFWMVTVVLFGAGTLLFRKLKAHFADVI